MTAETQATVPLDKLAKTYRKIKGRIQEITTAYETEVEQLKAQEEHLRESMIYAGRPGLWDDWLKFQAEAARRRKAAQEAEIKRKKAIRAQIEQAFWWSVLVVVLACGLALAAVTVSLFKGRG